MAAGLRKDAAQLQDVCGAFLFFMEAGRVSGISKLSIEAGSWNLSGCSCQGNDVWSSRGF
jgi:hypothetical protein